MLVDLYSCVNQLILRVRSTLNKILGHDPPLSGPRYRIELKVTDTIWQTSIQFLRWIVKSETIIPEKPSMAPNTPLNTPPVFGL